MQTVNCLKIFQIVAIYMFIQFQFDKKKCPCFADFSGLSLSILFINSWNWSEISLFFYNFIFHRKCQIREIIEFLSKNLENVNKLSRFTLLFSHPFWDFIVKMSQPEKYWILVKNVNKLSIFCQKCKQTLTIFLFSFRREHGSRRNDLHVGIQECWWRRKAGLDVFQTRVGRNQVLKRPTKNKPFYIQFLLTTTKTR